MRDVLWIGFVVAVIASGGPVIALGAAVVGLVVWAVFWL